MSPVSRRVISRRTATPWRAYQLWNVGPSAGTHGLLSIVAVLLIAARCAAQTPYTLIDLGPLPPATTSFAHGLNDRNQVAGWTADSADIAQPVRWTDGLPVPLGTLPGFAKGYAVDLNSSGWTVGYCNDSPYDDRAFLTDGTVMIDLGTIDNGYTRAHDINEAGQVVGYSGLHAYLWDNGLMTNLGSLGGGSSNGYGVNRSGSVTGFSYLSEGNRHAFRWINGLMSDLGALPGFENSEGLGINDRGDVVGYSVDGEAQTLQAWGPSLWEGAWWAGNGHMGPWFPAVAGDEATFAIGDTSWGQLRLIGSRVGGWKLYFDINPLLASGGSNTDEAFVGFGSDWVEYSGGFAGLNFRPDGHVYAVRRVSGGWDYLVDLGTWTPGSWYSCSVELTASDEVVIDFAGSMSTHPANLGAAPTYFLIASKDTDDGFTVRNVRTVQPGGGSGSDFQATFWNDGVISDLGTLGGGYSIAHAVNERRQVVGYSQASGGSVHGFLWHQGVMTDLNDLAVLNPLAGWEFTEALDINDAGAITGTGTQDGVRHAFLLLPQVLPFVEEWDAGIDAFVWKRWGDPAPFVRVGECTAFALDPNGDANYQSGVTSWPTFDLLQRPMLRARAAVHLNGEPSAGAWQNLGFGFSTTTADATTDGPEGRPTMLAEFSLNPGLDVRTFTCQVLGGVIYEEPWNPADEGVCREYRIEFDEQGHVLFFRDGQFLAISPQAIDLTAYRAVAVNIDGRSYATSMALERLEVAPNPFAIQWVQDVPADQGGWCRVKFGGHPSDQVSEALVNFYGIWRALSAEPKSAADMVTDPAALSAGRGIISPSIAASLGFPPGWWEGMGSIPAVQRTSYSTVVRTLGDQSPTETPLTTYVVSAHTANPTVYFVTEAVAGYSADNLVPEAPTGFTGKVVYSGPSGQPMLRFDWQASVSDDVAWYDLNDGGAWSIQVSGMFYEVPLAEVPSGPIGGYRLRARDYAGNLSAEVSPEADPVVTDGPSPARVTALSLGRAHPNPFNPATIIPFAVPAAAQVSLDVYDAAGRHVRTLVAAAMPAGQHQSVFDGRDDAGRLLASGAYRYVLRAGSEVLSGQMLLVK